VNFDIKRMFHGIMEISSWNRKCVVMNYKEMTKEELVDLIEGLDTEATSGKYGLIWDKEKEPETIVVDCDKKLPVLNSLEEDDIVCEKGRNHILIKGDNFHSLTVLNYTHKESIDIIYIDPPYNTGNRDFMYNDKYVDYDDGYRHSKWLNFMQKRLKLAKKLLKKTGVIFISIGDNEVAQLRLLCDSIFSEHNFITCCSRVAKRTSNKGNFFKPTKDYVLVYARQLSEIDWKFGVEQEVNEKEYKYEDEKGKYKKNGASLYQPSLDSRPNQRYWIECPDGSLIIPPGNVFPKELKDGAFVKPESNADKVWRWSYESYLQQKDRLIFTKASSNCPLIDSNGKPSKWNIYDKVYLDNKLGNTLLPEDVIYDFVNSQGTKEVLDLDLNFSFAKPVGLIKYLIKLCQMPKDITVLDFFAGSGTTAQAVLELNAEDGGNRRFILCTNDEGGICTEVTYPRIERIINGYKNREAIPANLKYFETEFVDNSNNRDQLYYDLTEKCIPMLCMKEDCFEKVKITDEYMIFSDKKCEKYTCVYFDLFGEKETEFIDLLNSIPESKVIYKFSLGDYVDESQFAGIENYRTEAVPYRIVELYRKLVKMSKEEEE